MNPFSRKSACRTSFSSMNHLLLTWGQPSPRPSPTPGHPQGTPLQSSRLHARNLDFTDGPALIQDTVRPRSIPPLGLSISLGTDSERLVLGAYCIILMSSSSMTCVSRWALSRPAFGATFFVMMSLTAWPILPVILLWDGKPGHRQP